MEGFVCSWQETGLCLASVIRRFSGTDQRMATSAGGLSIYVITYASCPLDLPILRKRFTVLIANKTVISYLSGSEALEHKLLKPTWF